LVWTDRRNTFIDSIDLLRRSSFCQNDSSGWFGLADETLSLILLTFCDGVRFVKTTALPGWFERSLSKPAGNAAAIDPHAPWLRRDGFRRQDAAPPSQVILLSDE